MSTQTKAKKKIHVMRVGHGVGFERDWVTYYSQRPNVYPGKLPSAVLQITFSTCILSLLLHPACSNYIMKMAGSS